MLCRITTVVAHMYCYHTDVDVFTRENKIIVYVSDRTESICYYGLRCTPLGVLVKPVDPAIVFEKIDNNCFFFFVCVFYQ